MKKTILTAAIAAMVLSAGLAMAVEPLCGDVNNSSSITTSDALRVLKKSVDQPITLDCSAYDNQFAACDASLTTANASLSACLSAPACGNGLLEGIESCEVEDLNGATCATKGFAGGTLACSFCSFDTSGCYATRFEDNGDGTVTVTVRPTTYRRV